MSHPRFKRNVWIFRSDLVGSLAKWLAIQSPYPVPDNLSTCLSGFHDKLETFEKWDGNGMAEVDLSTLTERVYPVLESIPEVMALNEKKSGRPGHVFVSRHHDGPGDPDDDFIDIMAVAQNIACDFADSADAQAHLDNNDKET